ncbi:galactose-1-phosphate uridylyltransferase [Caminibacter sp.]
MSEIRYSPLFDEYVIIAPERLHRPIELKCENRIDTKNCPFCPENEKNLQKEIFSIRIDGKWMTKVIPNLYKALRIENPFYSKREGVFEKWGGYGAHEVIIDTPNHYKRVSEMSEREIFYWLKTIMARYEDLKNDKKLIVANVYKNVGINAGASLSHPHSQIIATPIMSSFQRRFFKRLFDYYKIHGRTLIDDLAENEEKLIDEEFKVFNPYASFFAFETIITTPFVSISMDEENLKRLAAVFKKIIDALYAEIGEFDFNVLFYLPPMNKNFENEEYFNEIDKFFKFFIRITPRIYKLAGFEMLSGSFINPLEPSFATTLLRKKIAGS